MSALPNPAHELLPPGFEALSPFVADWGLLETEDQRYRVRQRMSMAQLQHFYDAMTPAVSVIFDHLDQFAYGKLPGPEERLFRLALGLAEAAQAVEVVGAPTIPTLPEGYAICLVRPG